MEVNVPRVSSGRTVLVANRLPATIVATDDGARLEPSVGGVATGLKAVHDAGGGVWVGWPGEVPRLSRNARSALDREFSALRLVPVPLSVTEVRRFYEGYANGVLWPLFHYQLERLPLDSRDFDEYRKVNEKYADVVARHVQPGDDVWIHDYQLALLPGLLRERIPDARIGFFLHIPFPAAEVFRTLPQREAILRGVLGADLVGFHTVGYLRHFAASTAHCLGLEPDFDRVGFDGRNVQLGVFPMGVDSRHFADLAADDGVRARAVEIRAGAPERLVVGIDRIDYTKGLRRRLLAFGRLLERSPEWRGRVRYVQIAVPSRTKVEAYVRFGRELDELVGRINAAYTTAEQVPIHYVGRGFDDRELTALYRAADVCVVTPLRDGMNLVAKEFVASRTDDDGVLVLSEFAGASAELGEALIVNPFDIDGTAAALGRALEMPREERATRMRTLRSRVVGCDVDAWSRDFLRRLGTAAAAPRAPARQARMQDVATLVERFGGARRLVLFLDYDGTLVPLAASPALASPDANLLQLLTRLGSRPGVALHVVSGRPRADLARWLGRLPVGLHAEHGVWSRSRPGDDWTLAVRADVDWKERLRPFLDQVTISTPGSMLEEKTAGFAWHWRGADPEYGARQALDLRLHLADLLTGSPVEVIQGEKLVEVRLQAGNKGAVVARVLAGIQDATACVAIGDDRTDEDLFAALPPEGTAVRVGLGPSGAEHRLADWMEVRRLLEGVDRRRQLDGAAFASESGGTVID